MSSLQITLTVVGIIALIALLVVLACANIAGQCSDEERRKGTYGDEI